MSISKNTVSGEDQHVRMTETPIAALVSSLAIPTVLSQLVTIAYNTADTYFVSKLGKSATAAVGVVFSYQSIIQAFGFGIGMGASSLISRRLGAKKLDEANTYAGSAFFGAMAVGCVIMALGLLFPSELATLLGATDTMLPYAVEYARYIFLSTPIMCGAFVLNMLLRSEGEATYAMVGLCVGGILNIFLDPLFIFSYGMGAAGAALATAISQCVSFILLLLTFIRGKSIISIHPKHISRRLSDYWLIISTGFPTLCRQGLASIATALINIKGKLYGDAAVASLTIANKVYLLIRNIIIGIGQGYQPVAGYNYGAKKYRRVKKSFWFSTAVGTVICTGVGVLMYMNSEAVISWFISDAEVIALGGKALCICAAVMPLMAYSTFVNQLYQCLGFRLPATFLACCRQGVMFLPLIFILPSLFGLTGVQLSQPGADLLTFIISIPFQIRFMKTVLSRADDT